MTTQSGTPPLLTALAMLVVKDGLAIGGLSTAQQSLALGLAWALLPAGSTLREKDVNVVLKSALSESCRFLSTDHVELRRWLVDGGWLSRDGFGREYRRVARDTLREDHRPVADALLAMDPTAWVRDVRQRAADERRARRQTWEANQANQAPAKGSA